MRRAGFLPTHWPDAKARTRSGAFIPAFILPLALLAQPANDNPCAATVLTVAGSCSLTAATNNNATATPGIPAPGCANYQGRDVWFRITVPANGAVSIRTTAGGVTDGGMAAYYATACNGTYTLVECDNDDGPGNMPQLDLVCLTPGATLYVRFWRSGNGGGGTFNICAVSATPPAAPANDDPCGAITLTAGATCGYVAGTTVGACGTTGPPAPGCGGYSGYDTWYSVTTATAGTLTLTTTANSITDGAMAVYTAGVCGGPFTLVDCDDNDGPAAMPEIVLACQSAGTWYVRFWQNGGGTGTFNICATLTPIPANDDPCGATVLAPNTSCTYTSSTTVGACNTTTPGDPGCGSYNGMDVWFLVTTPSYGSLSLTTAAGTITDGAMAVYTATACNGTFTLIDCDDDSGPNAMPLIDVPCGGAATYYVRFWQFNGGGGTFDICAVFTALAGAPVNDNPCSATALTVGTSCSATNGYNNCGSNNASPGDPGCGTFTGGSQDVWYSFTAPASGMAIIEVANGTLANASMALYSGTCGSLTLVECDADDGTGNTPAIFNTGLTPGNTYFIRLWGTGSTTGSFTICVSSPAAPVGFACSWLIEMFDTGGDGWGTSQINVSINGGPATSYTVTQAFNALLIGLNIGQTVSISYTNTGANQAENSYRIRLNAATMPYYNSGSPPGTATFSQTVNCLPPSQSQEDCLGAKTLCGSSDETANPQNIGNVSDLFPSNYGCLASAERQGLWYIFRMSAGGNLGMTIDPDGNDDYDWAIWGPYTTPNTTGSVCVPASAPVRCSYASGPSTFSATGSYNTGMGHPTYGASPQFANPLPAVTENSGGDGWVRGMVTVTGDIFLLYVSNYSMSGLAFLLTWQTSNGASLDCTVLPVEFLSLSATAEPDRVAVQWSTLTEHNSDYFVVERSADAEHFLPIGTVEAAGESLQRIDYSFVDVAPLTGANYYRLKQVDMDGAYEHTPSVVVLFGKQAPEPTVFPNPVTDVLNVAFEMPVKGTAYVQVVDVHGHVVRDRDLDLDKGPQTLSLPVQDLPSGTYGLRLVSTANGGSQNVRFIKD